MRLLLDTHAYIWCAFDPGRLSPAAVEALAQPASELYVSTASLWEFAVKSALGKLTLPLSLREMVEKLRAGRARGRGRGSRRRAGRRAIG